MPLNVAPVGGAAGGAAGDPGEALLAAQQAQATAENARQMARNVRTDLAPLITAVDAKTVTLQQLADAYQQQLQLSLTDRASLRLRLEELSGVIAAVQATPGPQGDTGPAGPVGPPGGAGPMGPAGPQGLAGPAGATGSAGAKGETGATGLTGPAGTAGAAGLQGELGPAGPAGAQGVIGATGPAGAAGAKGETGATGPKGDVGAAGATGPAGAQGIQGIQGIKGDAGPAGAPGPAGATGPAGPAGPTGPTGPQGPAGGGAYAIPRTFPQPALIPATARTLPAANAALLMRVQDAATITKLNAVLMTVAASTTATFGIYRSTGTGINARPTGAPVAQGNVATTAQATVGPTLAATVVADGDWFAIASASATIAFSGATGVSAVDGFAYSHAGLLSGTTLGTIAAASLVRSPILIATWGS